VTRGYDICRNSKPELRPNSMPKLRPHDPDVTDRLRYRPRSPNCYPQYGLQHMHHRIVWEVVVALGCRSSTTRCAMRSDAGAGARLWDPIAPCRPSRRSATLTREANSAHFRIQPACGAGISRSAGSSKCTVPSRQGRPR
jgi:hypothetical protein